MAYAKKNKLHIVAVTAVIRRDDGRFLVLKRRDDEIAHPGLYSLPGGKVEDNQKPAEALAEEIMEESGLVMKPGRILLKDTSFVRPDGQTVKVFAYMCEVEDSSKVNICEDFTDYKWVTLEELKQLRHIEQIQEELIIAEKLVNSGLDLSQFKI